MVHSELARPVAKLPPAHTAHEILPTRPAVDPGAHAAHEAPRPKVAYPRAHPLHLSLPSGRSVPAKQSTQAPVASRTVFAEHSMQRSLAPPRAV